MLALCALPSAAEAWSKEAFLEAKNLEAKTLEARKEAGAHARRKRPLSSRPGRPHIKLLRPDVTLLNLWTMETVPLGQYPPASPDLFEEFFRCRHDGKHHPMDPRLISMLREIARRFRSPRIEIVSAYRSPDYNAFLRNQGREVARESQHMQGKAIDFRVPGVPVARVYAHVKARRLGGAGYYPVTGFVHMDTGPVRSWRGR